MNWKSPKVLLAGAIVIPAILWVVAAVAYTSLRSPYLDCDNPPIPAECSDNRVRCCMECGRWGRPNVCEWRETVTETPWGRLHKKVLLCRNCWRDVNVHLRHGWSTW